MTISCPPGWNNRYDGSPYAAGWRLCVKCNEWRHPDLEYLERYAAQHPTLDFNPLEWFLSRASDGRFVCAICGKFCRNKPEPQVGLDRRQQLRKLAQSGNYHACPPPLGLK